MRSTVRRLRLPVSIFQEVPYVGVRKESVELSLNDDGFSTKMAKDAASVALLNRELGNLNGTSARASTSTDKFSDSSKRASQSTRQASDDLNKYTGRLSLLVKSAAAIGPVLAPIGASVVPAITGLAAGLGAAAGAAGVAALAFSGVGDAIKAMDAYKLAPTTENLQAMQQAMDALGPSGAQFAKFIDGLEPQLQSLQDAARQGMFPGVEEGIKALLPLLPQVESIVSSIGTELGNLSAEAGNGIANDAGFQKFFNYLQTDAAPTLDAFATATGHVASGLASLMVDVAPLSRDFTGGLVSASEAFQKWADGLGQTQGFHEFLAYVEKEGPQVVDLLKSVATTALDIAEAFAPVGSATLPVLTALAKIIGTIASSPLGPVIAAVVSIGSMASLAAAGVTKLGAAWDRVAASAGAAAAAEEAATVAGGGSVVGGGKGKLGKAATVVGLAALGTTLIPSHPSESASLSSANLSKIGSKLSYIEPSIGGMGQGTINKIFGASDSITGIFGHTSDLTTERSAAGEIDQQLSSMVSSGEAKKAADSFAIIEAAAKKSGATVSQVAAAFPAYTAAVKDASSANTTLGTSSTSAAASIRNLIAAQEAEHQTALQNFDATTSFGQAIQALAKQAAAGTKGFNEFTAAGAANRASVSSAVEAYNAQSQATKNSVSGYSQMTSAIIKFATKMGATKAQIAAFTSVIDKPKKLTISTDTGQAITSLKSLKAYIDSLKGKTVTIRQNTILTTQRGTVKPKVNMPGSALGSTVPKDGGPYADRYPYLLAPGEEVTSNQFGQADNARRTLKLINAGRITDQVLGLAAGGTAGDDPFNYNINSVNGSTSSSSSSSTGSSSSSSKKETAAEKKKAAADEKAAAAAAKASASLSKLSLSTKNLDGKEFKDLRSTLHDLVGKDLKLTGDSLKDLNKASKALSKSLDSTKSKLSAATSNRDSVVSSVTGSLSSDLWTVPDTSTSTSSSVWTSSSLNTTPKWTPQYAISQLNGEGKDAKQFSSDLAAVQKKGITGAALSELLTDGGPTALHAFAAASAATDRQYQAAYNRDFNAKNGLVTVAAKNAGQATYGAQIADLQKEVKTLNHNVKDVTKAIKDKTTIDKADRAKNATKAGQEQAKQQNKSAKTARKRG